MLPRHNDPIAAIATAPGRGAVGIVRVSGKGVAPLVRVLCGRDLKPREATYLPLRDAAGGPIDHGLALFFPAPHSYTGEDVLELQAHGGPVVLQLLLARCLEAAQEPLEGHRSVLPGLRLAQPGEFTERAFLNDKIDLAQAEAIADLIDASTEAAARSASRSLSGAFSEEIHGLRDALVHLRMLVEATLDFPEEEIDFLQKADASGQLARLRGKLDQVLSRAHQGALLREGIKVVIAGQPNAGKSSLLNALAGAELAIVTPIAGTTRDKVVQEIHIDGVPLHIVDTAGLRETEDTVESIGIARSWQEIERADLILHLQDATQPGDELDAQITARLPPRTPMLKVFNKVDLLSTAFSAGPGELGISAKRGLGLDALRAELLKIAGWNPGAESPWLARERHLHALQAAAEHLALAGEHAKQDDRVLDLFAEELRLAHDSLSGITGKFTSDDLLGEIFSSFCIGK